MEPYTALLSAGMSATNQPITSSSNTGQMSLGGISFNKGIDPVFVMAGLGLALVFLLKK